MILVHFDLETGGLEPHHPTIQLAAVAMDGASELGAFSVNIAFREADADPEALKMNHYDPAAWLEAVPPHIAASKFAAWLRPYQTVQLVSKRTGNPYTVAPMAGYNALTFDWPRLRALFGTAFLPCSYHVRDVLQRAIFYFDEACEDAPADYRLTTVAAHFGIPTDGAHGALADARMSARVYNAIREEW